MDELELQYDSLEAIPESHRGFYVENDGVYTLPPIRGMKTETDVRAVQEAKRKETNDKLAAQQALKKYEALGKPADELVADLSRLKELEILGNSAEDVEAKAEELAKQRVAAKLVPLETSNRELSEKYEAAVSELQSLQSQVKTANLTRTLKLEMENQGIRPEMQDDILAAALSNFDMVEGEPSLKEDNIYGLESGHSPATFFRNIKTKKSHWWPESKGSGAKGSGSGSTVKGNPFHPDSLNLTEQNRLYKEDPETATRLAAQVGIKL